MFLAASLLTQALLALPIMGSPVEVRNSPITIPLTRRLNFSNGTINPIRHDEARVVAFRNYKTHGRRANSITVPTNFYDYTIAVGIGSPATTYKLLIDTGSAITWIGNDLTHGYEETGTSVDTGEDVTVRYGSPGGDSKASFEGTIYNDTVSLGGGLTVTRFPLGIAFFSEGFDEDEDGVLGLGPRALTRTALIADKDKTIPTITDYLHDQGRIDQPVFGIFFQPHTTNKENQIGELTFGGPDHTKYTDRITYFPITTTPPASRYWGIDQSITYGTTSILESGTGIIDTGTSLIEIATDAFEKYEAATGGTFDRPTGLLTISLDKYNALQNLNFHIWGETFTLTPNAQIWPRPLNTMLEGPGQVDAIYLIVKDIGSPSGKGLDFINGLPFMQRFYSVFDGSKPPRIGLARTPFTDATTN